MSGARLEFCGEVTTLAIEGEFVVGREGDLHIDDNPFLHRRFLVLRHELGFWWLINDGVRLSATVSCAGDGLQAWLPPKSRLPLVFGETTVVFTAGPVTYEFSVQAESPTFRGAVIPGSGPGVRAPESRGSRLEETLGDLPLTDAQKALIVVLAEPLLRRDGTGSSRIPSSAQAAERLGWSITKFNRKLDNVCEKFDRIGVSGLRPGPQGPATNRRTRLVEYALAARIVTRDDLPLLDLMEG